MGSCQKHYFLKAATIILSMDSILDLFSCGEKILQSFAIRCEALDWPYHSQCTRGQRVGRVRRNNRRGGRRGARRRRRVHRRHGGRAFRAVGCVGVGRRTGGLLGRVRGERRLRQRRRRRQWEREDGGGQRGRRRAKTTANEHTAAIYSMANNSMIECIRRYCEKRAAHPMIKRLLDRIHV